MPSITPSVSPSVSSSSSTSSSLISSATSAAVSTTARDNNEDENGTREADELSSLSTDSYVSRHHRHHRQRLRFDRCSKLYGREVERDQLLRVLDEASSATSRQGVALIRGVSGVGKSVFVTEVLRQRVCSETMGGYFAMGKYEQFRLWDEPFSALVAALSDLVDLALQEDEEEIQAPWREQVLEELSHDELHVLSELIGNFRRFLRLDSQDFYRVDEYVDEDEGEGEDDSSTTSLEDDYFSRHAPPQISSRGNLQAYRVESTLSTKRQSGEIGGSLASVTESWGRAHSASLQFACRKFLQIAAQRRPLVIFIDDLQFADSSSLELLSCLMMNRRGTAATTVGSHPIVWIGAFRDDSRSDVETLQSILSTLDRRTNDPSLSQAGNQSSSPKGHDDLEGRHRIITLRNLSLRPLQNLLSDVLRVHRTDDCNANEDDDENDLVVAAGKSHGQLDNEVEERHDIRQLSELVWHRTNGNPMVVVEFMQSLVDRGMLRRSSSLLLSSWEWDLARIQASTNVCDNIVPLLEARIQMFRGKAILSLAALLGFRFSFDMLAELVRSYEEEEHKGRQSKTSSDENSHDTTANAAPAMNLTDLKNRLKWVLLLAEQNSFIESSGSGDYKFTHDRIQQCFYELQSREQRLQMHVKIGNFFASRIQHHRPYHHHHSGGGDEAESILFLVVDQLERGSSCLITMEEKAKAADMAYRAAKLSMRKSSFRSATGHLRTAINWLRQELGMEWVTNYTLTLAVYTTAAEAEYSIGRLRQSAKLVEVVLKHSRTLADKMRAYYTLIASLGSQGRLVEAMSVADSVLLLLGEKFPKRSGLHHVAWEMTKTKLALNGKSDENILNLPAMTDEGKRHAMELMSINCLYSRLLASDGVKGFHFVVAGLRMIQVTLRYGMCPPAMHGFAGLANLFSAMGSYEEATRYGELALKMGDVLFPHEQVERVRMNNILYHSVMHWNLARDDHYDAFRQVYLLGMSIGDMDTAFNGLAGFTVLLVWSGKPLGLLEAHYREAMKQMRRMNCNVGVDTLVHNYQRCLNLMGLSEDPVELSSELMNENETILELSENGNLISRLVLYLLKLELALHFEAYAVVEDLLPFVESKRQMMNGHISQYHITFTSALAHFILYRKTRRRHFWKKGLAMVQTLEQWKRLGNPHCDEVLPILAAEVLSLESTDTKLLCNGWDEAIKVATEHDNLRVIGVANERAACIFSELGEPDIALNYVQAAINSNESWEADAKVDFLCKKYHNLLPVEEQDENDIE